MQLNIWVERDCNIYLAFPITSPLHKKKRQTSLLNSQTGEKLSAQPATVAKIKSFLVYVLSFEEVLSHHHKTPPAPRGLHSLSPWRQAHPVPNNAIFGAAQRASLLLLHVQHLSLIFFWQNTLCWCRPVIMQPNKTLSPSTCKVCCACYIRSV